MRAPGNFNLTVGQMLKLRFKWMVSSVLFFVINLGILFLVGAVLVFAFFILPAIMQDKPVTAKPPSAAHQRHR